MADQGGDDYYAKLKKQAADDKSDGDKEVKKIKIVPKKKIKITKKEVAPTPEPETTPQAEEAPKEDVRVSAEAPKISFGAPKKEEEEAAAPKDENTEKPTEEKAPEKEKPGRFRRFKPDKKKEEGGDQPGWKKKKYKSAKKSVLKRRGSPEIEHEGFRRGKMIQSKAKAEKSVEDIKQELTDRTGQEVEVPEFLTVKELSEKIGVPIAKVIGELLKNGVMVNLNSQIDFDTSFLIGEVFNVKIKRGEHGDVAMSDILEGNVDEILKSDDAADMVDRSPIVSVMGHVDHGKTSILDYIRKSQVAEGEAGGITQSIGSYQAEHNGKSITFLDTPGHEAFAVMRARGAKLTDIIIIVVAADEGLKPQTIESINLAKEAEVPVIVAINKMDKEGANPDLVKGGLAEHGLQPEDWGGETICVPVSAKTGLGIEDLLEMILLVSDMKGFKAHPSRPGVGTVIESHLDPQSGVLATVLVNAGIFKKGDPIVIGGSYGKIRTMKDFRQKNISKAGPSTPILISGLSEVVEGGDIAQVVKDAETARTKAQELSMVSSSKSVKQFEGASLASLMNKMKAGSLKQLKIVLKADTNGSLEAIKAALLKIKADDVEVQIIHSGVGAVNESDVLMAGTSTALLVGFNVSVLGGANDTLNKSKIEFINDKVIYRIIEKVEAIATGMVDVKYDEVLLGEAKVKEIFYASKEFMVVGMEVTDGKVENKAQVKVIRDERTAGTGNVDNLKKGVENVAEVEMGEECGIQFKGDIKIKVDDQLEFFKTVERK